MLAIRPVIQGNPNSGSCSSFQAVSISILIVLVCELRQRLDSCPGQRYVVSCVTGVLDSQYSVLGCL